MQVSAQDKLNIKNGFLRGVFAFIKGNAVLSIAILLAIITAFIIPPDNKYLEYFDFKTLTCLFCVLAVVNALKGVKFFTVLATKIVKIFKTTRSAILALVYVTFIGSMLIANDMAHKLGAFYHLPHGISNALLIEQVMRFNAEGAPAKMGTFPQYSHPHTLERYAEIADALSLGGKTDKEKFERLIAALRALKSRIGIKDSIKDYVEDEKLFLERLDELSELAFDDQCTGANPRYPLLSEIRSIYLAAYYGKEKNV